MKKDPVFAAPPFYSMFCPLFLTEKADGAEDKS